MLPPPWHFARDIQPLPHNPRVERAMPALPKTSHGCRADNAFFQVLVDADAHQARTEFSKAPDDHEFHHHIDALHLSFRVFSALAIFL